MEITLASSKEANYDLKTLFSCAELLLLFLLVSYYSDSFTVSGYSMSIKECKVKLLRTRDRIFNNLYNYSSIRFQELLSFSTQRTYAWPPMNRSWPPLNRYVQLNYIPEKGKGFCVLKIDCKVVKTYCKTTKHQNNGIFWWLMRYKFNAVIALPGLLTHSHFLWAWFNICLAISMAEFCLFCEKNEELQYVSMPHCFYH